MIIEGLKEVIQAVKDVQKQASYAASLAINETAKKVQWNAYEESNKDFHIRKPWNKPNTKFGFNRTYATKSNLRAEIGSKAPWLALQEYGGTENKDKGKYQPILVPIEAIQQSQGRLVQKKYALSTIKADPIKARAFQIKGNWWVRINKSTIQPIFFKEASVSIKPVFPFTVTATKVINENYSIEFNRAWQIAFNTAK